MNLSSSLIQNATAQGDYYQPKLPSTIANVKRAIAEDVLSPIDYVGEVSSEASIAVLDLFRSSEAERPMHGDEVNAVILNHGFREEDTAKIRLQFSREANAHISNLLFQDGPESFSERLDAYISLSATHALSRTNGVLHHLAKDEHSKITTINQSQGESRYGVFNLLRHAAYWNGELSEVGKKIAQACGLESPGRGELLQALSDRVEQVIDNSHHLQQAQERHVGLVQELAERGVVFVSSAGNNQDDVDAARAEGIEMSETFDDDLTSVGRKLVVGALDTKGTQETEDDEVAFFSSRYKGVNILADGVDVTTLPGWLNTGTSFAAPAVAAKAEEIQRQEPDQSSTERLTKVAAQFPQTDGYVLL